ncbi:hypothetical protein [Hydrogenispora ethanolica]|uniref:hypothetical protein n=1 Tax=Hydrogenispora ethanolica TaxID=1082276 RepID=UPI001053D303|nr:hypothetical protein [Hydrogenispora ethanolica]
MAKCQLDFSKFNKQWKGKMDEVENGVKDGFAKIAPDMRQRYQYYQQQEVYEKYQPSVYQRTNNLKESTTSEITEDDNSISLTIFSDPNQTPSNKFGSSVPYSYIVTKGYKLWNTGKEMFARDWVEPMAKELQSHLQQSGIISVIINEVNKRIR